MSHALIPPPDQSPFNFWSFSLDLSLQVVPRPPPAYLGRVHSNHRLIMPRGRIEDCSPAHGIRNAASARLEGIIPKAIVFISEKKILHKYIHNPGAHHTLYPKQMLLDNHSNKVGRRSRHPAGGQNLHVYGIEIELSNSVRKHWRNPLMSCFLSSLPLITGVASSSFMKY